MNLRFIFPPSAQICYNKFMPAKNKTRTTKIRFLKRLRDSHNSPIHKLFALIALIVVWWGTWTILDIFFLDNQRLLSATIAIVIALVFLLLDDFHLKELE